MNVMPTGGATAPPSPRERRCVWSGVETDDLEAVEAPTVDRLGRPVGRRVYWVRPRDRAAFLSFNSLLVRWGRWFLPALVLVTAIMVVATAFAGQAGLGAGLLVLGLFLFCLPLATPETVEMLGIHASVLLARGLALGLFCAGAFLLVLPAAR